MHGNTFFEFKVYFELNVGQNDYNKIMQMIADINVETYAYHNDNIIFDSRELEDITPYQYKEIIEQIQNLIGKFGGIIVVNKMGW